MSFINFSNHSSANWSNRQIGEARKWGEIRDVAFPAVSPNAVREEIYQEARRAVDEILRYQPDAVMCHGEFTLTYAVVDLLKKEGILVLAACSERKIVEEKLPDGTSRKTAIFDFCRFREY